MWPHDNALIAAGFMRYDIHREAMKVLDGMYDAMAYFRHRRLPELFCRDGEEARSPRSLPRRLQPAGVGGGGGAAAS